jgi:CRISP-associated protein Cas1
MKDLHVLPKVRDSWSYLYAEHRRVDQEDSSIALHDAMGTVPVPSALLTLLMLGPGTTITHAAIRALADSGTLVMWTGEEGVRLYAQGFGETRSAHNLLHQAKAWANPTTRLDVVIRMYALRFNETLDSSLTLRQIRGKEGLRVRQAYALASKEFGIEWQGRSYKQDQWDNADPINRALSTANSCLYGVCHAAIVSAGYSPGIGFVHTGKMLSFVYDIADLYKVQVTIPIAFREVAAGEGNLTSRVRHACRDAFREQRILERIVPDIDRVLGEDTTDDNGADASFDTHDALPSGLWEPDGVPVDGGVNYADVVEGQV